MQLNFKIENEHISLINATTTPVNKSVNFLTASFDLDDAWDGFRVTAVFNGRNNMPVGVLLDGLTNICTVPWEALQSETLKVSCYGMREVDGKNIRITSNVIEMKLDKSGPVQGAEPATPDFTSWEQVITRINDINIDISMVSKKADEAELKAADALSMVNDVQWQIDNIKNENIPILRGDIGYPEELITQNKENLVGAINEIKQNDWKLIGSVYNPEEVGRIQISCDIDNLAKYNQLRIDVVPGEEALDEGASLVYGVNLMENEQDTDVYRSNNTIGFFIATTVGKGLITVDEYPIFIFDIKTGIMIQYAETTGSSTTGTGIVRCQYRGTDFYKNKSYIGFNFQSFDNVSELLPADVTINVYVR